MQREFGVYHFSSTSIHLLDPILTGDDRATQSWRGRHEQESAEKLVEGGIVRDWDDPRLYTLIAIRRRGIPPGALLSFVNELGVTTNRTVIQIARFEQNVRRYLENTVPRLMFVLDPVPVTISDIEEPLVVKAPYLPKDPTLGSHTVRLTKTVYINRSDFREQDSKGVFRLEPGEPSVSFRHHIPSRLSHLLRMRAVPSREIQAIFDKESKPKTYIQWVPEDSIKVEARIHHPLFKSEYPTAVEGGFMNGLNSSSETVYPDALIEECIGEVPPQGSLALYSSRNRR